VRVDLPSARALLAARLDNIGDVVMTGPALRALRAAAPQARITLLCSPTGSLAAPLLPWLDDVLVRRVPWQDASGEMPVDPGRELDLIRALREGAYDAAFVFTSFSQSPHAAAYACYLAGIPIRVGSSKEFGGSVLSHAVPPLPDTVHQVERNTDLLAAVGLAPDRDDLEIRVPDDARTELWRRLEEAGIDRFTRFAVAAPGASCSARRYPPDRFSQVARLLSRHVPVVVVGSRSERELLAGFADAGERVVSLVGETSVPEMAAAIEASSLVVTNNSAAMHLADAVRTPVAALYSGTDLASQWAPRDTPSTLLRRRVPCAPCHGFSCPYDLDCLDIPPDEVAAMALARLEATPPPTGKERVCDTPFGS
jgi:ADP-heptose:LPS heptosyltransferase